MCLKLSWLQIEFRKCKAKLKSVFLSHNQREKMKKNPYNDWMDGYVLGAVGLTEKKQKKHLTISCRVIQTKCGSCFRFSLVCNFGVKNATCSSIYLSELAYNIFRIGK